MSSKRRALKHMVKMARKYPEDEWSVEHIKTGRHWRVRRKRVEHKEEEIEDDEIDDND